MFAPTGKGGNMFRKKYSYEIIGILFTAVLGTLLHFLYEWSDRLPLAALFSPINESVWEHLKLLFFPFVLYSLWELFHASRNPAVFLPARTMGLAAGLVFIPLLFYSYTAVLGTNYLALDITVFLLSILLAFFLSRLTERKAAYPSGNRALFRVLPYLSMAAVLLLFALFVLFTFRTPRLPLFRDPVNGSFGI